MRPHFSLPLSLPLLLSAAPLPAQVLSYTVQARAVPPIIAPDSPSTTVTATLSINAVPGTDLNSNYVVIIADPAIGFQQVFPVNSTAITVSAVISPPINRGSTNVEAYLAQSTGRYGFLSGPVATVPINVRPTPLASALAGDYVFQTENYTGSGRGGEGASVGALTFSAGTGGRNTVTGLLDYNGKLGTYQALPVTGTYALGVNGRGKVTLTSSVGTQHLDLFANTQELPNDQTVSQALLVETDGPQLVGSGKLYRRAGTPVESGPASSALINLSGQVDTAASSLPASVTGSIDDAGTSATVDEALGASVRQSASLAFTQSDYRPQQNRLTFSLTDPSQPGLPRRYAGYAMDPATFYVISLDPIASTVLLSGEVVSPSNP